MILRRTAKVLQQPIPARFRELGSNSPFPSDAELSLGFFGKIYALNSTGALIWSLLESEHRADEATEKLAHEYSLPKEMVAKDVEIFIQEMLKIGLIEGKQA